MKQGATGKDYAEELWNQSLVGLMFGTWTIDYALGGDGEPDPDKIDASHLEAVCPQPQEIKEIPFDDRFLQAPRRFLLDMSVDDRVVVAFNDAIHIGTIGEGFLRDPNGSREPYGEYFKCRPVQDKKSFPLEELPGSYRLLTSAGRSAIQRTHAYRELVNLLDVSNSAKEVEDAVRGTSNTRFLDMLSDKQWEVVSEQYLRDTIGLRSLLLAVGGTLKSIDIYGVDGNGKRVLAQCKNDSKAWTVNRLEELISGIPTNSEDRLYFFCRGGVEQGDREPGCTVVDGRDIVGWLDNDPDYAEQLKAL
ncbi:MAG: hypothetical protein Q9183_003869 [Haloplaca sp. 2 TL-2023]